MAVPMEKVCRFQADLLQIKTNKKMFFVVIPQKNMFLLEKDDLFS